MSVWETEIERESDGFGRNLCINVRAINLPIGSFGRLLNSRVLT